MQMQGLQEQLLAKGSGCSQVSAMSSKQVWKEPKLVSVTFSSRCINNHLLFMAVLIAPACLPCCLRGWGRAGCSNRT